MTMPRDFPSVKAAKNCAENDLSYRRKMITMPPLPEPDAGLGVHRYNWSSEAMKSYAAAVRAATIEECAKVCERLHVDGVKLSATARASANGIECAAAIRSLKDKNVN